MYRRLRQFLAAAALALMGVAAVLPAGALAQTNTEGLRVIEGNLKKTTGVITIPADTLLRGNVEVVSGGAVVDGLVDGNVEVTTGYAHINGAVTGDVKVVTGNVRLGPQSVVKGRVAVVTGDVHRDEGARVDGGVGQGARPGGARVETEEGIWVIDDEGIRGPGIYVGDDGVRLPGLVIDDSGIRFGGGGSAWRPDQWRWTGFHFLPGFYNPLFRLLSWAGLFALAAAALALVPRHLERMAVEIGARPVHVGLVGLAVMVLTPFALVLMVLTIIGIPAIPFALLAWAVAKFLGYVALSLLLGELLARTIEPLQGNHGKAFLRLLLGTLVLALAGTVPVLGELVGLLGAFLGLGAVWVTRFGTGRPRWFGGGGAPSPS